MISITVAFSTSLNSFVARLSSLIAWTDERLRAVTSADLAIISQKKKIITINRETTWCAHIRTLERGNETIPNFLRSRNLPTSSECTAKECDSWQVCRLRTADVWSKCVFSIWFEMYLFSLRLNARFRGLSNQNRRTQLLSSTERREKKKCSEERSLSRWTYFLHYQFQTCSRWFCWNCGQSLVQLRLHYVIES